MASVTFDGRSGRPARVARALLALAALGVVVALLWWSVGFLADPLATDRAVSRILGLLGADASAEAVASRGLTPASRKLGGAGVALLVGVGGVWALFVTANHAIDTVFGDKVREQVRPWLFVGPAVALIAIYLVVPTIGTIRQSLTNRAGEFTLAHYRFALTDPAMLLAFRNNVLWLVLGTLGSVVIGVGFAALVDRLKREALAKTFIFLPMAISFVGASVIWRFVYAWQPTNRPQTGLLNAIVTGLGFEAIPVLSISPLNTVALIVVMIWLQTGFAMVIFSAAIKSVPGEVIEAARLDGAGEFTVFRRIVVPMIRGTILTVATTIFIAILKVFDIVWVMGRGGNFETEVVATRMFKEMFQFQNFGRASALAVILLLVVVPVMVVNIRNMHRQGVGA
ncbi:carbohydrate ABC transporter permease [Egicoccus sp. AB-alg6-2]|uniref:carbohydrate ABC transporter permease n=1 Tax=Egicoccus sp. AB-alg6-2 TaxID=3242692 RepID=UPI00359CBB14